MDKGDVIVVLKGCSIYLLVILYCSLVCVGVVFGLLYYCMISEGECCVVYMFLV